MSYSGTGHGAAERRFFVFKENNVDLYIYSDESGVFDKAHNEIFVYGGLIFLGKRMIATENILQRKRPYAVEGIRRP